MTTLRNIKLILLDACPGVSQVYFHIRNEKWNLWAVAFVLSKYGEKITVRSKKKDLLIWIVWWYLFDEGLIIWMKVKLYFFVTTEKPSKKLWYCLLVYYHKCSVKVIFFLWRHLFKEYIRTWFEPSCICNICRII